MDINTITSQPLKLNDSDEFELFQTINGGNTLINWARLSFKDFFDTYLLSNKVTVYNREDLKRVQEFFCDIYHNIVKFAHVPTSEQNEKIKMTFETIFNDTSHDNSINWLFQKKEKILHPELYVIKRNTASSLYNVLIDQQ